MNTKYTESSSCIDLLYSTISHASLLHYSKNAALLILCSAIIGYYGVRARWLSMLAFAIPINYAYAHVVGAVIGSSGGTFALLGVVTVVIYRRDRRATLALVPLGIHQLTIATPEITVAHTIAWAIGISMFVTVGRNTQSVSHARWPSSSTRRQSQP